MLKLTKKVKLSVVTTALAATLGTGVALAPSASADPFRCGQSGSDPRAWCAYVKNSPNGLTVRKGPGTNYGSAGTIRNGAKVEIECWTYGSSVGGYNIWTRIYSNPGNRFVSDKYLTTGHVQSFLPRC